MSAQAREAQIERMATSLYDFLNTDQRKEILVSKADCIELAGSALDYIQDLYADEIRLAPKTSLRERSQQKLANRKILSDAFRVVRHDPTKATIAGQFRDALAGRSKATPALLDTARETCASGAAER